MQNVWERVLFFCTDRFGKWLWILSFSADLVFFCTTYRSQFGDVLMKLRKVACFARSNQFVDCFPYNAFFCKKTGQLLNKYSYPNHLQYWSSLGLDRFRIWGAFIKQQKLIKEFQSEIPSLYSLAKFVVDNCCVLFIVITSWICS